ncbi:hypothetical protein F0P96_18760 [Hymenobacter busanensis]|uniref:Uncharacterized protein n=1 Tax=Hymenobacter busanensis TaxID=2607656 RepID=A0A7L4ZSM9_9BACT|nr:hypothetical protein [Hymenobacter busanensis]KAA9325811.1 hypothetical protein F0P96_18760 [Hymenobacter busanensis]QHJ06349.1 hypothetical protein GUY19_03165 [Hymenobacter busanensis]
MDLFDNLAKAAKDFFVEGDDPSAPGAAGKGPATPQPPTAATAPPQPPLAGPAGPATFVLSTAVTQPEQRHLDHVAALLAGDGRDFVAYTKMVKSMAASGLTGPVLYQTAYNAFAAVTGLDAPTLLASAEQFEQRLQADRAKVLERHREKLGEVKASGGKPSAIVQLVGQEQQLQADLAELTRQLEAKNEQLQATQQQLVAERQKAQAALASYELANTTAAADLQAHRQAAQSFLLGPTSFNTIHPR